jgi:hypothetical protein
MQARAVKEHLWVLVLIRVRSGGRVVNVAIAEYVDGLTQVLLDCHECSRYHK